MTKADIHTQATSRCRIQLELETPLGKALIEENSNSIVEINNVCIKRLSTSPAGTSEQTMFFVASFFKGITLNKMRRLDHESLRGPETSILKWLGYTLNWVNISFLLFEISTYKPLDNH